MENEINEIIERKGEAVWNAFVDIFDPDPAEFEERFMGVWNSEVEYAEEYIESTGDLDDMPESLQGYFDYEAYARDLFTNGFIFDDDTGAVFFNH